MQIIKFTTEFTNISKAEKLGQRLQFGKRIKMTQPNWYHSILQTVQKLLLIKQFILLIANYLQKICNQCRVKFLP